MPLDLIVWKPNSGPLAALPIPAGTLFSMSMCENQWGKYIFVGGSTGQVFVFDITAMWAIADSAVDTPRVPLTPLPKIPPPKVLPLSSSSSHNVLHASIREKLPKIEEERKNMITSGKSLVSALAAFNHGPYIAVSSAAGIQIYDYQSGAVLETLGPYKHTSSVYGVAVSPDDETIVTASFDTHLLIWKRSDSEKLWTPRQGEDNRYKLITKIKAEDSLRQVAFSPDGLRFVTSSNKATASNIYFTHDGSLEFSIPGPMSVVNEAIFSSDGKLIYSACCDQKIRVTDVATKATIGEIFCQSTAYRLALGANDELLVATLGNHSICIWSTATLHLLRKCEFSTFAEYALPVLTRSVK